jgi:hypothetical protein
MKLHHRTSGLLILGLLSRVSPAAAQETPSPTADSPSAATSVQSGTTTERAGANVSAPSDDGATQPPGAAAQVQVDGPQAGTIETPAAQSDKKDKKGKRKDAEDSGPEESDWERGPKIRVSGYVYSAFYLNDAADTPNNEFRVRNARLQLAWQQGSLLDGVVEVEMSKEEDKSKDGTSSNSEWSPLRDAYARVSPFKALRVRMGQFKRPFSRLALTSHHDLRLIDRGVSYAWVSRELDYGDRDVGFQVEGSFGKNYGLDYSLGVFNGTGRNAREIDPKGAKDFVGRVEGRLGKHVSVGANFSNKRWDNPPATVSYKSNALMLGADAAVDYKGFYGMVEGAYGDYFSTIELDKSWYVLALMAYKIKVTDTWDMAVEPLVKGELLTPRANVSDSRALVGTAGANLHLGKVFRLMVQGEWIHPNNASLLPSNLGEAESMKRVIVQVALHTK